MENSTERLRRQVLNRIYRLFHGSWTNVSSFTIGRDEAEKRRAGGSLENVFYSGAGRPVHKWIDYLPIYERFFSQYRGTDVKMLEIGVSKGGSLDMWRSYFGPRASIFGIDIDPACADRVTPPNQVKIGSQDDPVFLKSVIEEMGQPDIILDDGSHVAVHQRESFRILWPLLKDGGIYAVEDTHTAYWPAWGGGYRRGGSAVEMGKQLVDDMHGWFHTKGEKYAPMDEIGSVMFFESIYFIEKRRKLRPGSIQIDPA